MTNSLRHDNKVKRKKIFLYMNNVIQYSLYQIGERKKLTETNIDKSSI